MSRLLQRFKVVSATSVTFFALLALPAQAELPPTAGPMASLEGLPAFPKVGGLASQIPPGWAAEGPE